MMEDNFEDFMHIIACDLFSRLTLTSLTNEAFPQDSFDSCDNFFPFYASVRTLISTARSVTIAALQHRRFIFIETNVRFLICEIK